MCIIIKYSLLAAI